MNWLGLASAATLSIDSKQRNVLFDMRPGFSLSSGMMGTGKAF